MKNALSLRAALSISLLALAACGAPHHELPPLTEPRPSGSIPVEAVPPGLLAPPSPSAADELAFAIDTGDLDNRFVRSGRAAAHVLAASGRFPRVVFAFPAGDTGAGLWFEPLQTPAPLTLDEVTPVDRADGLAGASAVVQVGAPALYVRGAVLGSVRALREYASTGAVPRGFEARIEDGVPAGFEPHVDAGSPVTVSRTMFDGKRIAMAIEPLVGATVEVDAAGAIRASAAPGEETFTLRVTALTEAAPLTPIPSPSLLSPRAAPDPESRDALAFLAYREKLLAGSWRFLTYFGRDTLLSLQMMMPALGTAAIEAGLGSVLDRLGPEGEVAHEEAIGEWALLVNRARGLRGEAEHAPVFDYSMVDDDFLLAPALASYLLDTPEGRARAASFLTQQTGRGETYREAARKNFERVLLLAAPFAASGARRDLIALKPGTRAGDWRDSDKGLGGGRVPYDVNAALVPAALDALSRLFAGPCFGAPGDAARAQSLATAWRDASAPFRVELPEDVARERVASYAAELGLDPAAAQAFIQGPVVLDAIALDASGEPIPILHTDVAFTWLYDAPPSDDVERAAVRLFAPFPAGLVTPVGVVVASPAFAADPALRATFTRHDYHGTVVWSWQQALLAAGIAHQLGRSDLSFAARRALEAAESSLWKLIRDAQARGFGTAELWSFGVKAGRIELVPFGEGHGDADESNAVQLWSTAYLAVRPSWER